MIGNPPTGRNSKRDYSDYKGEYSKQLEKETRLAPKDFKNLFFPPTQREC